MAWVMFDFCCAGPYHSIMKPAASGCVIRPNKYLWGQKERSKFEKVFLARLASNLPSLSYIYGRILNFKSCGAILGDGPGEYPSRPSYVRPFARTKQLTHQIQLIANNSLIHRRTTQFLRQCVMIHSGRSLSSVVLASCVNRRASTSVA